MTIAKGLNRPLSAVYRKVTRMYDTRNYVGRYTKEEERLLLQLYRRVGANWIEIGFAMGRSPASVKDKIRLLKQETNKGIYSDRISKLCYNLLFKSLQSKHFFPIF